MVSGLKWSFCREEQGVCEVLLHIYFADRSTTGRNEDRGDEGASLHLAPISGCDGGNNVQVSLIQQEGAPAGDML